MILRPLEFVPVGIANTTSRYGAEMNWGQNSRANTEQMYHGS